MLPETESISVRKLTDTICVLDFHGELNSASEAALMRCYEVVSSVGAQEIILNFEKLTYMNSSGIGLLVTLLIRARHQNQRLYALNLIPHYRQIFHFTRLEESIPLIEDERAVLSAAYDAV